MKLSVIIPSYKRNAILLQTLKDLETQECEDFEIIVVNQSKASDELTKYLDQNPEIRYFEQLDKQGAVYNRNLGIEEAKGEVVLFLDDDIQPLSDKLFSNHLVNYTDHEIAAVAGRVTQDDFSPIVGEENVKVGDFTKSGEFVVNLHSQKRMLTLLGGSGNLSARKEILQKINGFDENFRVGMREDSDLCLRINRDHKMVFDPTAGVHHLNVTVGGMQIRKKRSTRERINWYRDFFHNEVLIFLKHRRWVYFPIFIIRHKWRPIISCSIWYGRGNPHALLMPWLGILDGIRTYRREKRENSIWL